MGHRSVRLRRAVSLLAGNTGRRVAGPDPTDGGGLFQGERPLTRNEFGLSEYLHVQALQTRPGFDPEFPRQVGVDLAVLVQCLGGPSDPVESLDELFPVALTLGSVRDGLPDLGCQAV